MVRQDRRQDQASLLALAPRADSGREAAPRHVERRRTLPREGERMTTQGLPAPARRCRRVDPSVSRRAPVRNLRHERAGPRGQRVKRRNAPAPPSAAGTRPGRGTPRCRPGRRLDPVARPLRQETRACGNSARSWSCPSVLRGIGRARRIGSPATSLLQRPTGRCSRRSKADGRRRAHDGQNVVTDCPDQEKVLAQLRGRPRMVRPGMV